MSSSSWHNYGYGICTDKILKDVTVERIENLLVHAPKLRALISDYFKAQDISKPTVEDFMDYDNDYGCNIAYILQEVIEEAEGIEMCRCTNYENEAYLIYMPNYPWWLPENEANLTQKDIEKIIIKYASILTDTEIKCYYQSVENDG